MNEQKQQNYLKAIFRELLQFMDPKHLHWAREEAASLVKTNTHRV